MPLTDDNLITQRDHLGGVQRLYRLPDGTELSLVNAPMIHVRPFAWEAMVLDGHSEPAVFDTDDEANAYIAEQMAAHPLNEGAGNGAVEDAAWEDGDEAAGS